MLLALEFCSPFFSNSLVFFVQFATLSSKSLQSLSERSAPCSHTCLVPFPAACSLFLQFSSLISSGSVPCNLSNLSQSLSSRLLLSLSVSNSVLSGLPLFSHVLAGSLLVLKLSSLFRADWLLVLSTLSKL